MYLIEQDHHLNSGGKAKADRQQSAPDHSDLRSVGPAVGRAGCRATHATEGVLCKLSSTVVREAALFGAHLRVDLPRRQEPKGRRLGVATGWNTAPAAGLVHVLDFGIRGVALVSRRLGVLPSAPRVP